MEKFYSRLGLKKFRILSILAFLICDLFIVGYIYNKGSDRETFNQYFESPAYNAALNAVLEARGQGGTFNAASMDPTLKYQLFQLAVKTLMFMLTLLLVYHLILYLLYYKEKHYPYHYLKLYAWVGAPGSAFAGLTSFGDGFLLALGWLVASALFFFCAFGLQIYPLKKKLKIKTAG